MPRPVITLQAAIGPGAASAVFIIDESLIKSRDVGALLVGAAAS